MNKKSALWAVGLFSIAGAVTISCSGSSDSSDSTGTAGTTGTSTAGTTGTSTAGTTGTSTAGTGNNSTAGSANNGTAGTDSPGTAGTGNNGTAGSGNNNGAAGADNGAAGADDGGPGAGGAGPGPMCPATKPAAAPPVACMRGDGGFLGCTYGDQTCRCQRTGNGGGQNGARAWVCADTVVIGGGGQGSGGANGFGQATCPANAKNGNDCTDGPGLCAGQNRCICNQNNKIQCF